MPVVPQSRKWTKTSATLDTVLVGLLFHKFLAKLVNVAFTEKKFKGLAFDFDLTADDALFIEETHWHEVNGKRYRKTVQFLMEPSSPTTLTRFALVRGAVNLE
jgi:hypothetical protein